MIKRHLIQDFMVIVASIVLAVAIVYFEWVPALLEWLGDGVWWTSFVAGVFFTSVATTAPAIAVLGELSLASNIWFVAVMGAAGAVVGDYILFTFVRDRISDDISHLVKRPMRSRMRALMRRRTFKWLFPFLAGLLIALPIPTDELGIAILAMTKLPTRLFLPLSFAFNTIGILLVGLAARALAS